MIVIIFIGRDRNQHGAQHSAACGSFVQVERGALPLDERREASGQAVRHGGAQDSSKGGAVEAGCSGLHYGIVCCVT